jgi:hypothetical protein
VAGTCGYGEGLSSSINTGNFLTSCKVYWLASQEELCSMEQVSKCIFIFGMFVDLLVYTALNGKQITKSYKENL